MKTIDCEFGVPMSGPVCFEAPVFHDERGFFMESFNGKICDFLHRNSKGRNGFSKRSNDGHEWCQDNHSWSEAGTLRGFHYQTGRWAQAKLVRAVTGVVSDYIVDIRPDSETFGEWAGYILDKPWKILYVPAGFAHGFHADNDADFVYKVDNLYSKEHEAGINMFDPDLNVDYFLIKGPQSFLVSEKDMALPMLKDAEF